MAIESHQAGEKQLAAERRAEQFPGLEIVTRLVSKALNLAGLQPPQFFELSAEAMRKNSTANLAYLHECLVRDVERLGLQVEAFESSGNAERQALDELVSEAVARTAEAKSKDRVKRVSKILAKALREGPRERYELERELIDTAVQIADRDAHVLGVIMGYQSRAASVPGVTEINAANETWKAMQAHHKEFSDPGIHVPCARLQAQGLIIRMDRIPTTLDLMTIPYAITEYGITFCKWCIDDVGK